MLKEGSTARHIALRAKAGVPLHGAPSSSTDSPRRTSPILVQGKSISSFVSRQAPLTDTLLSTQVFARFSDFVSPKNWGICFK